MDKIKNCISCGKKIYLKQDKYITIMHHQLHRIVCSKKCMKNFYLNQIKEKK